MRWSIWTLGLLHPVLVSRRYGATGGAVDSAVRQGKSGTLLYIDPYGAGAIAWHFVPRTGPAIVLPVLHRSSKNA